MKGKKMRLSETKLRSIIREEALRTLRESSSERHPLGGSMFDAMQDAPRHDENYEDAYKDFCADLANSPSFRSDLIGIERHKFIQDYKNSEIFKHYEKYIGYSEASDALHDAMDDTEEN